VVASFPSVSSPSVSGMQALIAAAPRLTQEDVEARKTKAEAISLPPVKVTLSDEAQAALAADKQRFALEMKKSELHTAYGEKIYALAKADARTGRDSDLYGEIRKDGKVIATVKNGGTTQWPGSSALSANLFEGEPAWGGTALAQHRLRALQKASGGEIVMARTAVTDPFAQAINSQTDQAPYKAEKQKLADAIYAIDQQLADEFGYPPPSRPTSLSEDPFGGDPPRGLTQDALDYLKAEFEDPDVRTALAGGGLQPPDAEQLTVDHALEALSQLNEDMKARFDDLLKGPNLYLALARQAGEPPKPDAFAPSPTPLSSPLPVPKATAG
jgi:hypothetical protein